GDVDGGRGRDDRVRDGDPAEAHVEAIELDVPAVVGGEPLLDEFLAVGRDDDGALGVTVVSAGGGEEGEDEGGKEVMQLHGITPRGGDGRRRSRGRAGGDAARNRPRTLRPRTWDPR